MERDNATPEPGRDWTSTSTPNPFDAREPGESEERPRINLWETVGDVTPWGTMFLLLSWCVVFALMLWRGDAGNARAMVPWGANVATPGGSEFTWRLLASTFIHANLAHLFFNALSQAIMGPAVERIFTRSRFWLLFATGAVVSGWASAEWRSGQLVTGVSVSVGASGAIFALGGAVLVSAWRLRHRLVPGRARALAGSLLILLVNGLVSGMTRDGTDNIAHLAGLLWGMAAGLVLGLDPRLSGKEVSRWVTVAGVLSAAALILAFVNGVVGGLAITGSLP
jgi:rhomboid protease GluP